MIVFTALFLYTLNQNPVGVLASSELNDITKLAMQWPRPPFSPVFSRHSISVILGR